MPLQVVPVAVAGPSRSRIVRNLLAWARNTARKAPGVLAALARCTRIGDGAVGNRPCGVVAMPLPLPRWPCRCPFAAAAAVAPLVAAGRAGADAWSSGEGENHHRPPEFIISYCERFGKAYGQLVLKAVVLPQPAGRGNPKQT